MLAATLPTNGVTRITTQILTNVITATPFRLSFFGGGTDFPGYFNRRGGLVVASAIRQHAYVALNCLERLLERRFRISYSQLEMVDSISEIKHDIVRAALTGYPGLIGESFVDIHSYADLPARSGVGSSSAFTVGLLSALHALNGLYLPPKALARQAIRVERDLLGEAGGWQDQITTAFGGFNVVEFRDGDFDVRPLVVGAGRRAAIESSCWLYFTSITRSSADVQRETFSQANIIAKETVLDQTRELAEEAVEIFLTETDDARMIRGWGELLDRAWTLKRSMSGQVSMPEIDALYERAKAAGAYGGKIIGAGGGGFLLIMAPPDRKAAIDLAAGPLRCLPVSLEPTGSRVVYVHERS
jgi:D-glycero-alpha-D-manno-heptose-7-phosphate kinase